MSRIIAHLISCVDTMLAQIIIADINSKGEEISDERPSGPDAEHRQPAKTLNHKAQQRKRDEKRRRRLALKHEESLVEYNTINHILVQNKEVEDELRSKTTSHSLADCSIQHFLDLKPVTKLYDFIHVRKFLGKQFQKSKLVRPGQTLNKTLKGLTSDQAIELRGPVGHAVTHKSHQQKIT